MPPTEHQGFLAAILAEPHEDLHRLAYADWLEEHDDPRAPFIRAHIAGQAEDLFDEFGMSDRRATIFGVPQWCYVADDMAEATVLDPPSPFKAFALVRRGFIELVRLSPRYWFTHHEKWCQAYPLREVELTSPAPLETFWQRKLADKTLLTRFKFADSEAAETKTLPPQKDKRRKKQLTNSQLLKICWPAITFRFVRRQDERMTLIPEERPVQPSSQLRESRGNASDIPKDPRQLANWLRGK